MLLTLFQLLRLGVYAPAQTEPFNAFWFYGSVQVYEQKAVKYPAGFEIGITPEFRKERNDVLSMQGERYITKPAYFAGLTKQVSPDLNAAMGVKVGKKTMPYISLSLRFGSVKLREEPKPVVPPKQLRSLWPESSDYRP